jgi:hypothetical protein
VRREVPILIAMIIGWVMVSEFFLPFLEPGARTLRDWTTIMIAVSQMLGVANVGRINLQKVSRRRPDWQYSVVLLIGMVVMIVLGLLPTSQVQVKLIGFRAAGVDSGTLFDQFYNKIYVPMQGTMFSLLAFFIASAAYRAFKIRTLEATILAITAVIVMIGRVPVGSALWDGLPGVTTWIMNVPQLAAKRAILIGAALGAVATGMKILLGLERNYLGES